MPNRESKEADTELLMSALEHVTRWNEFYRKSAFQIVNFFLLTLAVLGSAYVSALNGHQYAVAGVVALAGGGGSIAAYLIFRRQNSKAHLADEPLREIQERIADKLGLDSFRIAKRIDPLKGSRLAWQRSDIVGRASGSFIVVFSVGAAFYAWLR